MWVLLVRDAGNGSAGVSPRPHQLRPYGILIAIPLDVRHSWCPQMPANIPFHKNFLKLRATSECSVRAKNP